MNNIEKNLKEIYDLLFYPEGLNELLSFLNEKLENITKGGIKEGLKFDEETERELTHRIMLEGVPYFISDKLRKKLTQFEGSISEQPMLLAHPSGIKEEKMLNFISKENMSELVDNDYTCVPNKLYDAM